MYGRIRQDILNLATSTLPWGVQLRSLYDTISTKGEFSESDLVVLTNTQRQGLSDYVEPVVELVASPVKNVVTPAIQLNCLQLPTPNALTRSGDSGGHIQRGISRILRARPTLTSWLLQTFPAGLYEGNFGYLSRGFGLFLFRFITCV
jgi:hypothetical protein